MAKRILRSLGAILLALFGVGKRPEVLDPDSDFYRENYPENYRGKGA